MNEEKVKELIAQGLEEMKDKCLADMVQKLMDAYGKGIEVGTSIGVITAVTQIEEWLIMTLSDNWYIGTSSRATLDKAEFIQRFRETFMCKQ